MQRRLPWVSIRMAKACLWIIKGFYGLEVKRTKQHITSLQVSYNEETNLNEMFPPVSRSNQSKQKNNNEPQKYYP